MGPLPPIPKNGGVTTPVSPAFEFEGKKKAGAGVSTSSSSNSTPVAVSLPEGRSVGAMYKTRHSLATDTPSQHRVI